MQKTAQADYAQQRTAFEEVCNRLATGAATAEECAILAPSLKSAAKTARDAGDRELAQRLAAAHRAAMRRASTPSCD